MDYYYSNLTFYYIIPMTETIAKQSNSVSTYSYDYTSPGTDTYEFTVSKTAVIWTKTGYYTGHVRPPRTMFSITSDLANYEIDYVADTKTGSNKRYAPASGQTTYSKSISRLVSGAVGALYIFLKNKTAFEIPLTSNKLTCTTAQKYCDKNIIIYPKLKEKTVTPSSTSQSVTTDSGYCGLSKVTVSAVPTEEKTATENGEVTPTSGKYLSKVTVNVPTPAPKLEEKAVTITENGTTEITPSAGKDGISKVTATVNVPQAVPIDVSTADEMTALLVTDNVGKVYRFTGTTDATYTNGDLYEVVNG